MSIYISPNGVSRLGDLLLREFANDWKELRFAVAYAKMSGVDHIYSPLKAFASDPSRSVSGSIGIDQLGTSYEALAALLSLLQPPTHKLFICHNARSTSSVASPTFHPKLWLFSKSGHGLLLVGSGNLTQGGLYSNYEVGFVRLLDLSNSDDASCYSAALAALDRWSDPRNGDVVALSQSSLDRLHAAGLVVSEDQQKTAARAVARVRSIAGGGNASGDVRDLLPGVDLNPPPVPSHRAIRQRPPTTPPVPTGPIPVFAGHAVFAIELTTATKTEIYLAKKPLLEDPSFFGFPFTGLTKPRRPGNPPQPQCDPWPICDVTLHDATGGVRSLNAHPIKLWQYLANQDVRLYIDATIQSHITSGSILCMTRAPRPAIDYQIDIFLPGNPAFAAARALCTLPIPRSSRHYGWA